MHCAGERWETRARHHLSDTGPEDVREALAVQECKTPDTDNAR